MQRLPEVNPLIMQIKDTFYNDLTCALLDDASLDEANIDTKIKNQIQTVILNILYQSKKSDNAIYLSNGIMISLANCPITHLFFLYAIIEIKQRYQADIAKLEKGIDLPNSRLAEDIELLSMKIMKADMFKEMIPKVKYFVLEAKGIKTCMLTFDENEVTPDLIRATFYAEMVSQAFEAITNKWITLSDLADEEPFIYFALPALTAIGAIEKSRSCAGIRLLKDKMLTEKNCPSEENFPELILPILQNKNLILALTPDELKTVKYLSLNKATDLPPELATHKTDISMKCLTAINEVASLISRRDVYKTIVKEVIDMFKDEWPQLKPAP